MWTVMQLLQYLALVCEPEAIQYDKSDVTEPPWSASSFRRGFRWICQTGLKVDD